MEEPLEGAFSWPPISMDTQTPARWRDFTAAMDRGKGRPVVAGTSAFYRAMSRFRQGKRDEARELAIAAVAQMKPLPKDEKNPLANNASYDDLILWLAYKEAKALIQFDAARPPKEFIERRAGQIRLLRGLSADVLARRFRILPADESGIEINRYNSAVKSQGTQHIVGHIARHVV